MGIGLGTILLLFGLLLVSGVGDVTTPLISENTLGWLLIICGALAVVAALFPTSKQPTSPAQRRHDD